MSKKARPQPKPAGASATPDPPAPTPLERHAAALDDKGQPTAGAWLDAYLDLRAGGLDWRKAAFAAWFNAPKAARQPKTMRELAALLNYKSEQVFYKWQVQPWFRESGIDKLRQSIFQKFVGDVDRKTIYEAMSENGSAGVAARRLFYEMFRQSFDDPADSGDTAGELANLSDEDLDAEIERLGGNAE